MSFEPDSAQFRLPNAPRVPANIEIYVQVLGEELAMKFLRKFGGAELTIGKNPQHRSKVALLVGIPLAAELAVKGEHLPKRVPLAQEWLAQRMFARGVGIADIARDLRISDVTVRSYVRNEKRQLTAEAARQLRLNQLKLFE